MVEVDIGLYIFIMLIVMTFIILLLEVVKLCAVLDIFIGC